MMQRFVKVVLSIALVMAMALGLAGCLGGGDDDNTIVVVYYPNESAAMFDGSRAEFERFIEKATGRPVRTMLTTDYVIAIDAIASGAADIAFMSGVGYVEARDRSDDVDVLVVFSGPSGTSEDAVYFSWFAVMVDDADLHKDASGAFTIDHIQGTRMSFVSNSSTSGFVIPAVEIIEHFGGGINEDTLLDGDFFSNVLFGGSHQGALVNLLNGSADIATIADIIVYPFLELVSGEHNEVGAVYRVPEGAEAPFHAFPGLEFVLIESVPVLNVPLAVNRSNLSDDEIQAIRDLLTSDYVADNHFMFSPDDSDIDGFRRKTANERFVVVDDSWFNPIRRGL
jgi:phosphonate transport system substrate-binding protein